MNKAPQTPRKPDAAANPFYDEEPAAEGWCANTAAMQDIARRSATLIRALRESIEMSERIAAEHGAENTPALRSAVAWIAGHLHQNGDPAMAELFDNLLQVTS